MWIDSHNHLQDPRLADVGDLIGTIRDAGVERCVVNATRESDWDAVASLAEKHPDFILPAFGIHPWHAHTATDGWQEHLVAMLEKFPDSSIGECGIDGWIESPPMHIQIPIFLDQLRIANERDRPATIHCLKAWEPLFAIFEMQPPPRRFLMHSFGGSIEIARRLLPLGAYFSFSGYFLQPRKSKIIDVFRQLPLDRILVETDAPDMLPPEKFITHPLPENANHPANLRPIADALTEALSLFPDQLAKRTREKLPPLLSLISTFDGGRSMFDVHPPLMDLSDFRKEYSTRGFRRADIHPDPLEQFSIWFAQAVELRVHEPNAMTLATVGESGMPSQRTVLLKQFDARGFTFFTNYHSHKSAELAANPRASLLFPWITLEQVIVQGTVEKSTAAESDEYFRARPRESQLGAWVSDQSEIIPDREFLVGRLATLETEYAGKEIPRPPHWGGYRLVPQTIEFLARGAARLHDRFFYTREGTSWKIDRLSP